MANASFVILLSIPKRWSIFAMNAIMAVLKDGVSFVEIQVSRTPIIVANVSNKKKIEMVVPKLSI